MAHKPRLDLDQIQQRNISRIYSFRFGFLIFSTNQNAQNERSFILRFLYMIGYMDGWISDQTDTVLYGWMSTSSKVNKIEIIFLNIAEINFIFNEPKWKWASWKPFKVWIEFNDSKRREVGKDFLSSNNIHDATATTTQTLNTIFKSGPFPASFLFIFVFSIQLIINKCSINFADDWSRTADLWYRKRPLYQLSHNHFPTLNTIKSKEKISEILKFNFEN